MKTIALFVILCTVVIMGCSENTVDPASEYDFLTVHKTTFTSIALRAENQTGGVPCCYTITKNGEPLFDGVLFSADTILVDTDVRWGNTYTYKGYRYTTDGDVTDITEDFTVTVSDVSEDEYSIEQLVYGVKNSELFDVVCPFGGNVLAVGYIQTKETSINCITLSRGYNWSLPEANKFHYQTDSGVTEIFESTAAIGAISKDELWIVSVGGAVLKKQKMYPGTMYNPSVNLGKTITKIWGNRIDNVYFSGTNGLLWHFDGANYRRIETGFTNDITDMTGDIYPIIVAPGSPHTAYKVNATGIEAAYPGVQFPAGIRSRCLNMFVGEGGGYELNGASLTAVPSTKEWSGKLVRGAEHDMIAIGLDNTLMHYNGQRWEPVQSSRSLEGMVFNGLVYNAPDDRVFYLAGHDAFGRAVIVKGTPKR